MPYSPKPKKAATRANVAKMAANWKFFPPGARSKVTESVTSAIDTYHRLSRPDADGTRTLTQAGLPLPRGPQRGGPSSAMLVSSLAHTYAKYCDKLPTRSWDGAEPSHFEQFIKDVFQAAGIDESANAAVQRHIRDRNQLSDDPDEDEIIFSKTLKTKDK